MYFYFDPDFDFALDSRNRDAKRFSSFLLETKKKRSFKEISVTSLYLLNLTCMKKGSEFEFLSLATLFHVRYSPTRTNFTKSVMGPWFKLVGVSSHA